MHRGSEQDIAKILRRGTAWIGVASAISGVLDLLSTLACLWLWVSTEEFGVATMATALFPVMDRIGGLGLGAAAARHQTGDPRAMSSMFWLALACSTAVLGLSLAALPLSGLVFKKPLIGALLCTYAGKLVTQTFHLVPEAHLKRKLAFDTVARLKIAGSFSEVAVKLSAAYLGAHGHPDLRIFCFVLGPIANSLTMTIGYNLVRPWRPRGAFDREAALAGARFGLQLSLTDLLYFVYTSTDYLVIGAAFGPAAVGTYRLAYELVLDAVRLVSMVNAEVAFPAFVRLGSDRPRAAAQLVHFTRQNLLMVGPFLIVAGVAAGDLLAILYPPLGPAATTAAQILCIVGALRSASFVLPAMLAGLGHARDGLIYSLVAAIICPLSFLGAAHAWPELGYLSVAWAWAASYPVAFAVLLFYAVRRTGVAATAYLRGIAPVLAWAAATTVLSLVVHRMMPADAWVRAGAVVAATAASYFAFVWRSARER